MHTAWRGIDFNLLADSESRTAESFVLLLWTPLAHGVPHGDQQLVARHHSGHRLPTTKIGESRPSSSTSTTSSSCAVGYHPISHKHVALTQPLATAPPPLPHALFSAATIFAALGHFFLYILFLKLKNYFKVKKIDACRIDTQLESTYFEV